MSKRVRIRAGTGRRLGFYIVELHVRGRFNSEWWDTLRLFTKLETAVAWCAEQGFELDNPIEDEHG
jgi:hypothetical protein